MTRPPLKIVDGPPPDPPDMPPPAPPPEDDAPPVEFRSRSLAATVRAIEEDHRGCVGGALAWNEMLHRPMLAGEPLNDSDVTEIRNRMEMRIPVAGRQLKGMQVGKDMAHEAVEMVAKRTSYHPVRQYLESLTWDKVERIERAAIDIFKGADTTINRILIRRWFISAVARVMEPGCKVDTVLVLIGPQGYFKSTVFKKLAGDEWFVDSPIDIHSKDAFGTMRRAWILEWAELESLARARDQTAVRAFLASAKDTYRPPYGRSEIDVLRSNVIVGTLNPEDGFLSDSTGNRRWWPFDVTAPLDIELAVAWRDQLWAEAVELYRGRVPWWLTSAEEELLKPLHEKHSVADAWETLVLAYALRSGGTSTADILEHALDKRRGDWTKADEMRIGRIMRRAGWDKQQQHNGERVWVKA